MDDPGEIGMLQNGVNEMVDGLRERDRINDLFGRHVGPAVAAGGAAQRRDARPVSPGTSSLCSSTSPARPR